MKSNSQILCLNAYLSWIENFITKYSSSQTAQVALLLDWWIIVQVIIENLKKNNSWKDDFEGTKIYNNKV